MSRATAEVVMGLIIRIVGLFWLVTQVMGMGLAIASESFGGFSWWVLGLVIACLLLFQADRIVRLSYRVDPYRSDDAPGA